MKILEWIGVPLGALLRLCCGWMPADWLAILLFTLLTKVLLLPVSLWVQSNSIAMVRLMPRINRIKIKYYGDKDTIAEETQALYKREHYHPLVSTVPMLVQLVMLIGVIGAVRNEAVLNARALWVAPAAALAALLLGLAQNRLNPLQREQGKAGQWMTNGFSAAVSLALGAFVPLGVGLYWIFSNLLTVLQQMLLNFLMKPEKKVDYPSLAESKKELEALDRLAPRISKEDKKREKADYKKFFSVANKHLVFYSERSGFYKYFKDTIEYLLEKSNIIIHYVTNDPKDQIFALAKEQPRIRPYYIGERKLITLMMKMDADMVAMTCPDIENYYLKRSYVRKDVEYIYMFHYPLSTHLVYRTGALDHYDTLFCVGTFQEAEIRAWEKIRALPEKRLVFTGYGQLEQLHRSYLAMEKTERKRPKVLIAPSWQPENILESCIDPMLEELLGKGFEVVVRPHPEYIKRFRPRVDGLVARYAGREAEGLRFELDFSDSQSIFDSDILISDWSGTAYEFSLVTLKPAVFVDTKPKIYNPEYTKVGIRPLEFILRDQVGIRVAPDQTEGLAGRLHTLLEEGPEYAEKIRAIRERYIAHFGESGAVGGRYILTRLKEKQEQKRKDG